MIEKLRIFLTDLSLQDASDMLLWLGKNEIDDIFEMIEVILESHPSLYTPREE
jgi:hypothetical protein